MDSPPVPTHPSLLSAAKLRLHCPFIILCAVVYDWRCWLYTPGFSNPMYNRVYCSSDIPAPLPGCFSAVLTQIRWNFLDVVSFPSVFPFQSPVSLEVGDADTAKSGLILPQFLFKNPAGISPKKTHPKEFPVMGSYIRTWIKNPLTFNHYVIFLLAFNIFLFVTLPTPVQPQKIVKKKLFKPIWRS